MIRDTHTKKTSYHKVFLGHILLIVLGSVLFALIFPNYLAQYGLGFLSCVVLVPVALLIQRSGKVIVLFVGFLYGALSYLLFNIWLGKFAPAAFGIVPPIYGIYYMLLFLILRIIFEKFKQYTFIVQALAWLLYEYFRSTGFLGYTFGILGYSWTFYPRLIQSASMLGVWGITLFIGSISFFIAQLYYESTVSDSMKNSNASPIAMNILARMQSRVMSIIGLVKKSRFYTICISIYILLFITNIIYGSVTYALYEKRYDESRTVRIALTQHATDPWEGGDIAYRRSLNILKKLSEDALNNDNPPELVVWSETSFVPSISYHLKYRESETYTRLILELLDFLEQYPDTEFLIGNGEGVKLKNDAGKLERQDYNAALFFRGNNKIDQYYKIHLVPFTESFPYKDMFPFFYDFLLEHDVHFWISGDEYTVFQGKNVSFSTPICFEDGFGKENTQFIKNGADILVNITNDAWSGVEINAMQHLQLSIFRAVENRRTMVRSANSGMTGVIAPSGNIRTMLPSFEVDVLVDDVGIYKGAYTLYTLYNDWFVYVMLVLFLVIVMRKIRELVREMARPKSNP